MATAAEISEIIKLYVGYYNRAPDPVGLSFWIGAFDGGFDLDAMAVDFATQPETLVNYPFFLNPTPSVADVGLFVDAVYGNLFNRAPDTAGREFWATKIASGEFTVGEAISLIIAGATTSPDQDVVANKVAVGRDFFIKASALPAYSFGPADIIAATAIQASVDETSTSVTAAQAKTDEYVGEIGRVVINLTPDTDTAAGSTGDDVFIGVIDAGAGNTLQNSDSISGGGGNDTLEIRIASAPVGLNEIRPTGTSIEQVEISNVIPNAQFGVDMGGLTGVNQVVLSDSPVGSSTVAFNLAVGTQLEMDNVGGNFLASFTGDRSASTGDSLNLKVADSGTAAQSAGFTTINASTLTTDAGFEVLNLEAAGSQDSFLNVAGMDLEDLVVTGNQTINVTDALDGFADLESADASGMSGGGLNLNAGGNTQSTFSFTGSSGADRIALSNAMVNAASNLSLDGGAGSQDILAIQDFASVNAAKVNAASGFEVLEANGSISGLDASTFSSIDTFLFTGNHTATINVTNVRSADTFMFESDFSGAFDEMLDFSGASAGQTLNLALNAQAGAGGEVVIASSVRDAIAIGDNITSLNITSEGSNANANSISGSGPGGAFFLDSGTANVTLTGSQALTIGATVGNDLSTSGYGFDTGVNVNGSGATGTLRLAGSRSDDDISGGSGDDMFYALSGNNVLTGNGGDDQFRIADISSGSFDSIQDFTAGQDKIGFDTNSGFFTATSGSTGGNTIAGADYVDNLQFITNVSGADNLKLVELQGTLSETQITQTTSAGAAESLIIVFNSTSSKGEIWYDANWADTAGRTKLVEMDNVSDLATLTGLSNTDFVEYMF